MQQGLSELPFRNKKTRRGFPIGFDCHACHGVDKRKSISSAVPKRTDAFISSGLRQCGGHKVCRVTTSSYAYNLRVSTVDENIF
jgi:hypothetical protein